MVHSLQNPSSNPSPVLAVLFRPGALNKLCDGPDGWSHDLFYFPVTGFYRALQQASAIHDPGRFSIQAEGIEAPWHRAPDLAHSQLHDFLDRFYPARLAGIPASSLCYERYDQEVVAGTFVREACAAMSDPRVAALTWHGHSLGGKAIYDGSRKLFAEHSEAVKAFRNRGGVFTASLLAPPLHLPEKDLLRRAAQRLGVRELLQVPSDQIQEWASKMDGVRIVSSSGDLFSVRPADLSNTESFRWVEIPETSVLAVANGLTGGMASHVAVHYAKETRNSIAAMHAQTTMPALRRANLATVLTSI